MAAAAVKHPAEIHTTLNARTWASRSPANPAAIISGVAPGTLERAVVLLALRPSIIAGREELGSPSGRTASVILGVVLASNLAV
jgi:hypothetical protein